MSFERYRVALRLPGVLRLLTLTLIARAPNGMGSLGVLLLVSPRHGYARAGLVVGVYVAVVGVFSPVAARLCDRYGARQVLIATSAGYLAAMLALALVPQSSYAAELACAAVAGLMQPPVVAVVRGAWPRLIDDDHVQVLYGLEATAQELVFIVGPALVALLAAAFGPQVAVGLTGVVAFAGTVGVALSPVFGMPRAARSDVRRRRVLDRRLLTLVVLGAGTTFGFSMVDIGVIATMSGSQRAGASAGLALALWGAGSMVGGLLFGASRRANDEANVALSLLLVALGLSALAAAPNRWLLVAILFAGGATIAPAFARLYALVAVRVPESRITEAFAWIGVGFMVGGSLGASAGGFTVEALGERATFVLAGVLPALFAGALLVSARRPLAVGRSSDDAEVQPLAS